MTRSLSETSPSSCLDRALVWISRLWMTTRCWDTVRSTRFESWISAAIWTSREASVVVTPLALASSAVSCVLRDAIVVDSRCKPVSELRTAAGVSLKVAATTSKECASCCWLILPARPPSPWKAWVIPVGVDVSASVMVLCATDPEPAGVRSTYIWPSKVLILMSA
jgi:hypothetical protein